MDADSITARRLGSNLFRGIDAMRSRPSSGAPRPRLVAWLLTSTAALGGLAAGTRSAGAEDVVVFRDVRVFDGAKVVPSATVVVTGEAITRVGPGDQAEVPEGARVIDGKGKTLLPGLIDAHTHAFTDEHLRQAAVLGVTTELDMFTDHRFAARMRSEPVAGRADLRSAGTLVTAPGGHGTEYGLAIPTITEPGQASAFVDARLAEGSDFIKIVYDDGHVVGLKWATLDRPTLAAVVRAAHARKKLAVVHVLARENARTALAEGADGLVHLFVDRPADDEFVRLAAEKKAFVIPTLTVLESVGGGAGGASLADDPAVAPYLAPADARTLKATFPRRSGDEAARAIPAETVRKLKAAGVTILAGTDAVNPGTAHGASIHRELELLVAAGLSPAEALAAATAVPAATFGLADRGRIAPGLRADLVLVDGDPTADIKATRAIVGVWTRGRPVDRDAYRAALKKQADALADARKMPPPAGSEDGLVSDFEGDAPRSAFGSGWSVSTDSFVGGKSKAELKVVPGGAGGSKGSLRIEGTIDDRPQPRWAGALFSPGRAPMAPANLSAKKAISFWAKGDGQTYSLMLFTQSGGFAPATREFVAGEDWSKHRFALKDFNGSDGSGLMGVFLGGGSRTGPFRLQVDDVRFESD
jgi:imidazolonepropionase-like amidohydrolase